MKSLEVITTLFKLQLSQNDNTPYMRTVQNFKLSQRLCCIIIPYRMGRCVARLGLAQVFKKLPSFETSVTTHRTGHGHISEYLNLREGTCLGESGNSLSRLQFVGTVTVQYFRYIPCTVNGITKNSSNTEINKIKL